MTLTGRDYTIPLRTLGGGLVALSGAINLCLAGLVARAIGSEGAFYWLFTVFTNAWREIVLLDNGAMFLTVFQSLSIITVALVLIGLVQMVAGIGIVGNYSVPAPIGFALLGVVSIISAPVSIVAAISLWRAAPPGQDFSSPS